MLVTKTQKFKIEQINRKDIKNAPYNPRTITHEAMKKLKENIDKIGLLHPVVVNRNTMNIVSGHQRIKAIDEIEGTNDYLIDVSFVELTEKQEKEQNVFMNNDVVMGDWDFDLLGDLFKEEDFSYENTGWNFTDIELLFSDIEGFGDEFKLKNQSEEVISDVEKIEAIREKKRKAKEKLDKENDPDFYCIIVFPDNTIKTEFLKDIELGEFTKYIDGLMLHGIIKDLKNEQRQEDGGTGTV